MPFVSRFSHSNTVSLDKVKPFAKTNFPVTLSAAAELFSAFGNIVHNDQPCPPDTNLAPVNGLQVFERFYIGPALRFPPTATTASIALILWYKGKKGRLLTAEFSFRYEDEKEDFSPQVAWLARRFFEGLQRLDWAKPEGLTKTQYMYRRR